MAVGSFPASLLQTLLAFFVGELYGSACAFIVVVYNGFTLGMWLGELGKRAAPQTTEGQLGYPSYWNPSAVASSPLEETDMGCHVLNPCHVLQHLSLFRL